MELPQEIQTQHILPALRKELARTLCQQHDFTQKEAAETIGISPAAISQYHREKRATTTTLPQDVKQAIKQAAKQLATTKTPPLNVLYELTQSQPVQELTCAIHKETDDIPDDCTLCMTESTTPTKKHEGKQ